MRLRRVAKGIVRKGKKPSVYRIGFNNGDETELFLDLLIFIMTIQMQWVLEMLVGLCFSLKITKRLMIIH